MRKKAASNKAKSEPKLRRLRTGEFAYRIQWQQSSGEQTQSEVTEFKAIETLVKSPPSGAQLIKIETLDLNGQVAECIYSVDFEHMSSTRNSGLSKSRSR